MKGTVMDIRFTPEFRYEMDSRVTSRIKTPAEASSRDTTIHIERADAGVDIYSSWDLQYYFTSAGGVVLWSKEKDIRASYEAGEWVSITEAFPPGTGFYYPTSQN